MPIPASFDLSGRVALVTSAGSPDGIGFAAAGLLARLGAAVMVGATTSRIHDRVSELRGGGFDAAGAAGDLTHLGAASALVSAALDRWGRLDSAPCQRDHSAAQPLPPARTGRHARHPQATGRQLPG